MGVLFLFIFFWLGAILGETSLFTTIPWFNPNLFFLFACIFCLRWRGFETHFIAAFLGLTADCFSTIPYGIYGFSFLLISFFTRWYAVRIFQGSIFVASVFVAVATLLNSLLAFFILKLFDSGGQMTFYWLMRLISHEVMPTVVLCFPSYKLMVYLESHYKIRLAERLF